MKYLHFIDQGAALSRNQEIATGLGCGPVTTRWFNELVHVDGRRAFEIVNPAHEAHLSLAEQGALVETLWYQNNLSGTIHVSPSGTQNGAGTELDPISLAAASSALSTIAPGSTVLLHQGDYVGDYEFVHSGVDGNLITVSFENGARVKGGFTLRGNYVHLRNATTFDTPDERWTSEPGSNPAFINHEGLSIFGNNVLVTHPLVQDHRANGTGFWQSAHSSALHGLWTVNNGWDAPDRGHGHGLYTQNEASGPKLIKNCVFAQGYSGGIRAYTTNQALQDMTITQCISLADQIHLGGHSPASGCAVTDNVVFNDCLEIGETDRDNADVVISGNRVVNFPNTRCFVWRFWDNLTVQDNVFVMRQDNNSAGIGEYLRLTPTTERINNNTYYYQPTPSGYYFTLYDYTVEPPAVIYLTIAQWQAMGYDVDSVFIEGSPSENWVIVNHSEVEAGVAHVAVYNWESSMNVSVDLSGGTFAEGTYRAYNALNPGEYHEFVYTGAPVFIPMTGWTVAVPSGDSGPLTTNPYPAWGAFIVKGI